MYPELPAPADSAPARSGIAERLAQLVAVPTVSAERDLLGAEPFEDFVALMARLYPLVHARLEFERIGELGLVYRWASATAPTAAPVVLMAHWDVVPVTGQEAEWTHPPFGGVIAEGFVHGRGTLDDKGALCVLLEAVENLLAEDYFPARDVWLCLGGDEETHGEAARRIAETLSARGVRPWLVLDEGGAVSDLPLPGLSGWFAMIGLAEKGVMAVELTAAAEGGHASAPTGLTAVGRLSRAVARLNRNPFRPRLPRTVAAMMLRLAEHASPGYARAYRTAAAAPWLTAWLLQSAGHEAAAMTRTTVAPTMVAGGSAPNVLPSEATAVVNVRVNIGETTAGVTGRIRRAIGDPKVKVRAVEASEPSAESSPDTAQFALLARAVDAGYPGVPAIPYLVTGATDARHWHRLGTNVYRFAPLSMDAGQRASLHGVDERVAVDALVRGERCYRALLQGLDGQEDTGVLPHDPGVPLARAVVPANAGIPGAGSGTQPAEVPGHPGESRDGDDAGAVPRGPGARLARAVVPANAGIPVAGSGTRPPVIPADPEGGRGGDDGVEQGARLARAVVPANAGIPVAGSGTRPPEVPADPEEGRGGDDGVEPGARLARAVVPANAGIPVAGSGTRPPEVPADPGEGQGGDGVGDVLGELGARLARAVVPANAGIPVVGSEMRPPEVPADPGEGQGGQDTGIELGVRLARAVVPANAGIPVAGSGTRPPVIPADPGEGGDDADAMPGRGETHV